MRPRARSAGQTARRLREKWGYCARAVSTSRLERSDPEALRQVRTVQFQCASKADGERMTAQGPATDAARWVQTYGDRLYHYALQRVGESHAAEDLIQETFLAALDSSGGFRGEAAVCTWLVSILKRKIVDHFRRIARAHAEVDSSSREGCADPYFSDGGKWRGASGQDWTTPLTALDRDEIRQGVRQCVTELPPLARAAFVLREMEQLSAPEVCEVLNITAINLHVTLHRARLRLRECLKGRWSGSAREDGDEL